MTQGERWTPPVSLANCENEPIHIPGAIQPHGVLIALSEPDLLVRHVSRSASAWLGLDARSLLERDLSRLFTPESYAALEHAVRAQVLRDQNPLKLRSRDGDRLFDAILHRASGLVVVELEPTENRSDLSFGEFYRRVRKSLESLRGCHRVHDLARHAAREVRALTGFDRVMIYRFAPDGSGEVIAEEKREDLESFLGLHYPASDIPAQARRLYLLNWLRLIRDVGYEPSPIEPPLVASSGEPLDLSHSVLRSVSPIHIEYLRNMGVGASMSISLVVDGKLWGLVACHHYGPRFVPYEARSAAEFLGEALSWQIAARDRGDSFERQADAQRTVSRLVEHMTAHANPVDGLADCAADVLTLVGASGAALFHEGKQQLLGETPPLANVQAFVRWLARGREWDQRRWLFSSDAIATEYPDAPPVPGATGVLAAAVNPEEGDFLLWFRPEVVRTVNWAGDPNKTVSITDGTPRLSPRGSFALWKETVRGHSAPWEPIQADLATELRSVILGGIQKRATELARLNEELRASNLAKDEFLATVSHELRTPLNAMLGWLHLLETGNLPQQKRDQAMETIARNARNQAKLVEDLLDVARITSGKMRLDVQAVELVKVVEAALDAVRPAADAKGIRLKTILDPNAGPVSGDPQRLQQVVWNLLTNAVKFTPRQGKVQVRLARVDSSVEIAVSDDGIGIRQDFLPHVFERFRQAEGDSRRTHKGLGLGLSIVRHLVELHGGQVYASSDGEGRGATFAVRLPMTPIHARPSGEHPATPSERSVFEPRMELAGLRILVVDDEPDATELLGTVLGDCGVQVTSASSGFEALELLEKGPQDILISDIGMPGMDGLDLIRHVRALPQERNGRIPAVALTAFTRTQDRARAFLAGFDVYLPKPVDPAELVALLVSVRGRVLGAQSQPSDERAREAMVPAQLDASLSDMRILLAEPAGREERDLLRNVLEQAGAKVEVAETAQAAYEAARRFRPDLLLCAERLPDADAFGVLRALRAGGEAGGGWIPAVAMLEQVTPEATRKALLAGYQQHVERPISLDVLLSRIVKLVGWSVRRT